MFSLSLCSCLWLHDRLCPIILHPFVVISTITLYLNAHIPCIYLISSWETSEVIVVQSDSCLLPGCSVSRVLLAEPQLLQVHWVLSPSQSQDALCSHTALLVHLLFPPGEQTVNGVEMIIP